MKGHRKHIPIGVKLHACLLRLGFTEDEIAGGIEWNHTPPLALRFVDPNTGQLVPDSNDPRHIEPLRRQDHRTVTFGTPATTAGSDIHAIAKVRRIARDPSGGEEFRRRLLMREPDDREPRPRSRWPKRSFPKRDKP